MGYMVLKSDMINLLDKHQVTMLKIVNIYCEDIQKAYMKIVYIYNASMSKKMSQKMSDCWMSPKSI